MEEKQEVVEIYPGLMLFPELNTRLSFQRVENYLTTHKECKVLLSNDNALNLMLMVLLENNRYVVELNFKENTAVVTERDI